MEDQQNMPKAKTVQRQSQYISTTVCLLLKLLGIFEKLLIWPILLYLMRSESAVITVNWFQKPRYKPKFDVSRN